MSFQKGHKINNGKKLSEEHKGKISEAHKGKKKPWLSEPTKKRMMGNKNMLGKKHTEETKSKMSKAKMGHKHTEKHKNKLSETMKRIGIKPPSPLGRKASLKARENMRKARLGSKSNLWKGGVSKLTDLLRNCLSYRQWRSYVYERDDYTCIWCGQIGGKLRVDHIYPFSSLLQDMFIELDIYDKTTEEKYFYALSYKQLWDTNNGRTLCVECHKLTDSYGRPTKLNFNK